MHGLAGKTAVVTGAAHGIGRSTATLLEQFGAHVIAVDIDEDGLHAAFDGTAVERCVADVGVDGTALARTLIDAHGTIQLLVNNVGIETPHTFLELGPDVFDRVFAVNLRGPWFLSRAVCQELIAREASGAIVFVSSLHDTFVRTFPHYSASKAAISMLVQEMASELGPLGIRVNAVSPGAIHSRHVPLPKNDVERRRHAEIIPLGRIGEADDVARTIAALLNDEWTSYVTGANVRVDGGLGTHSWSVHPE
ncbi:MAG: putative short-chain dehydrogenase/reductase [Conexibacter sp.]|nr:putative short-chain dehydrogenase/reductase [Solirubrobacterales bacterium]MCW3002360.1 putative short-chain dehydrogenase/reductase [Conexibacter sp.]